MQHKCDQKIPQTKTLETPYEIQSDPNRPQTISLETHEPLAKLLETPHKTQVNPKQHKKNLVTSGKTRSVPHNKIRETHGSTPKNQFSFSRHIILNNKILDK
jgi:hypothetical protein